MTTLKLELSQIRLADIRQILAEPVDIELPDRAWRAVGRSRANVEAAFNSGLKIAEFINLKFDK